MSDKEKFPGITKTQRTQEEIDEHLAQEPKKTIHEKLDEILVEVKKPK